MHTLSTWHCYVLPVFARSFDFTCVTHIFLHWRTAICHGAVAIVDLTGNSKLMSKKAIIA
jgi:hypothetical protein